MPKEGYLTQTRGEQANELSASGTNEGETRAATAVTQQRKITPCSFPAFLFSVVSCYSTARVVVERPERRGAEI